MREYQSMIEMRETELRSQRQIFEIDIQAKEKDRHVLKGKLENALAKVTELQEENLKLQENLQFFEDQSKERESSLREDFEKRLNSFEDILNEKTSQNKSLVQQVETLQSQIERLEKDLEQKQSAINVSRLKVINPLQIKKNLDSKPEGAL